VYAVMNKAAVQDLRLILLGHIHHARTQRRKRLWFL
jgi:predicted phosphodiesterase